MNADFDLSIAIDFENHRIGRLSLCGMREQRSLLSRSGSIGIVLSTR